MFTLNVRHHKQSIGLNRGFEVRWAQKKRSSVLWRLGSIPCRGLLAGLLVWYGMESREFDRNNYKSSKLSLTIVQRTILLPKVDLTVFRSNWWVQYRFLQTDNVGIRATQSHDIQYNTDIQVFCFPDNKCTSGNWRKRTTRFCFDLSRQRLKRLERLHTKKTVLSTMFSQVITHQI